jgi:flavin-dependent dehydrogenase
MHGLDVVLFEQKEGPIAKACGEGLMPPALSALKRLGVTSLPGTPFKGIRYIDGEAAAEQHFSMGPGLGVRRTVLHEALLERAVSLGVDIRSKRVASWSHSSEGVQVEDVQARWLLAADGLHSPVRKKLGLSLPPRGPRRLGIRRHFQTQPWSSCVEVHWSPNAEAYVTPIGPNEIGVALLYNQAAIKPEGEDAWNRWIRFFPDLEAKLGPACSPLRGAGPFEQRSRSAACGRVLLIGDAAGYLDPITGEGIRLGLETAEAAIESIIQTQGKGYHQRWKHITRRYWWLTSSLLFIRHRPRLRKTIVPTLKRFPRLFRWVLDALNHHPSM